jgi:hypothetical protein
MGVWMLVGLVALGYLSSKKPNAIKEVATIHGSIKLKKKPPKKSWWVSFFD